MSNLTKFRYFNIDIFRFKISPISTDCFPKKIWSFFAHPYNNVAPVASRFQWSARRARRRGSPRACATPCRGSARTTARSSASWCPALSWTWPRSRASTNGCTIRRWSPRSGYVKCVSFPVECVENAPAWFAQRLRAAVEGAGTDDAALIRIIASRAEIDLGSVKREYERIYDKTLESDIKVCRGGFWRCLWVLCLRSSFLRGRLKSSRVESQR